MVPRAMPIPPTRGTGRACTFLGSGRSTMCRRGARRIMSGITAMLTTTAVRTARRSVMASIRHEPRKLRFDERRELREPGVRGVLGLAGPQRSHQPHQRTVAAAPRDEVPENPQLDRVFSGEKPAPLREPVVDELPRLPFLDHDAVDWKRRAVRPGSRADALAEALDLPAVGEQAVVELEHVEVPRVEALRASAPAAQLDRKPGQIVARWRVEARLGKNS